MGTLFSRPSTRGAEEMETGSAEYTAMSAREKMRLLWAKVMADGQPGEFPGIARILSSVLQMNMGEMQTHVADQIPDNHLKMIHCKGVVAQCEFISVGEHSYTGLFRGGSQGLVRLSITQKVDFSVSYAPPGDQPSQNGFGPGGSYKWLRDGAHSGNFLAINPNGADGQSSLNFFRSTWRNRE
jgi:hypothetical protein